MLVTHIHPDHYGLAGRVREASGAWIGLHPEDAVMLDSRYGDTDALLDTMIHFLADSGVPDDKLPDLAFASMAMKSMVTMAEPDVLFEDGRIVDLPGWSLRTVWTPGHSARPRLLPQCRSAPPALGRPHPAPHHPEHLGPRPAVPQSAGRLPRVAGQGPRPGCRRGPAGPRVPLRRPPSRVDEITAHHAERLEEIVEVVRAHPGSNAWEITLRLRWSRPWDEIQPFMQRQANGETLAHCVLLELHGRMRRLGVSPARFYLPEG